MEIGYDSFQFRQFGQFEFNFRMGCCLGKDKDKLNESSSWDVKATRSCTDVFCLVLFILYVGAMGALSVYGVYTGGAERLLYGMDSFGNICGMKNEKGEGKHIYNGQGLHIPICLSP